jgi:hypothetical protein
MNTTPEYHHAPSQHIQTEADGADTYFAEVTVYAGVLLATAEMVELLHDFLAASDPALRTHLGRFLAARHPDDDSGNPSMEANILLHELTEAADLLHTLAGRVAEERAA